MVQELVARLRFSQKLAEFSGKSVLDYGCGTGLALEWLRMHGGDGKLTGLDVSAGAVAHAEAHYPQITFRVADIASPHPDLERQIDIALCFEVLEHLPAPDTALSHLSAHYLKPDGLCLLSTPNRLVFSAGTDPSPINRTHLHEMDLEEFRLLLGRHFESVRIWGMRFREPARRDAWARMATVAGDGLRLLGSSWWNPLLNRSYRWLLRGQLWEMMRGRQFRQWQWSDFEFVDQPEEIAATCAWFFALASVRR